MFITSHFCGGRETVGGVGVRVFEPVLEGGCGDRDGLHGVDDHAGVDGAELVEFHDDRGDDAEVCAGAADCPEEVCGGGRRSRARANGGAVSESSQAAACRRTNQAITKKTT